jgi:uncharacterized protein (TIGR03437 family)
VAFDGTNFLVVWTANKKLDTVAYEVYCARVTPAGKVLDSPELQVTAGANAERMTPIVFDGTNFFIAWRNTGNNIYGTRLSKAGLSLDGPTGFPICTAASYYPNMAFDGTNFLVVWHGTPPGGDMFHYDVYGARVTKGGAVLDPNGFPIAVDATNKEHTGIDFDGTNYLVVWYDWRPNDSSQEGSIYGARVTPGGKVLDAQSFQIAPHARRVTPFVVFDGTQFVVAYHEDHAPHHRAVDAYARTVSTAGVPGEFIPLSTSKMTQFEPNLAYSNGLFLAAFSDYEPDARIRVELLRKTGGAALPVPSKPAGTPAGTPGIWTTEFNQDPNFFSYTLWGTATNNIYAVGIGWPGNLYHNDGSGWAPVPLLDTPIAFSMWGPSASDVWAGGWCGAAYHFDGSSWQNPGCSRSWNDFFGMTGFGPNQGLAVGAYGKYFTWNGQRNYGGWDWVEKDTGFPHHLWGVWGASANDAYAVGDFGTVLHFDGTVWTRVPGIPTQMTLSKIWGAGSTNIWAVGDYGTILHFDGAAWTLQYSGTQEHLYGIWGNSASNIYAVGGRGAVLRYDGHMWSAEASGTTKLLAGVWGTSGSLWAAGDGVILHRRSTNPPVLGITNTPSGTFTQGQSGASYTLVISNAPSTDPADGPVTVTETLPAGLTLASMAGAGWTCSGFSCTRSDVLIAGASYPPITVTVNVAPNAAPQLLSQAAVSGGGSVSATAIDTVNVAVCTVTVSPTSIGLPAASGSVLLTFAGAACGWTATSNVPWLAPAAASGTSPTLTVAVGANTSGVQRSGAIAVAGQTIAVTQAAAISAGGPSIVSLTPFQGTGLTANLTLVYSHPSGWAAIQSAEFILNPRWELNSRAGACYVKYAPNTHLFTLIADDGNSVAGTVAPGAPGSISNGQCTLNGSGSSVTGNGAALTVVAALTFQPTFTGQRHIWMQAADSNNVSTNWLVYGVWFPTRTTANAIPWYRIYDPNSKSYLYSADQNEYATLGARGFALQGISGLVMDNAATVAGVSNQAWYRVFVNATNSHLWTSDRNEFLTLINLQQAYVGEGVAAFTMPYLNAQGQISPKVSNTIPFYRAAFQGANLHFWTSDPDEFFGTNGKHLPAGYLGEGIACYIFPAGGAQMNSQVDTVGDSPAVISALNSASYTAGGGIAPGQAISIYGRRLGGRVLLNGVPVPVLSASESELRVLAPNHLAGLSEVTLEVEHQGRRSRPVILNVAPANPAIFATNEYGRGYAQARNQDGRPNGLHEAAERGSAVMLYATGIGAPGLPVEVHIGGLPADVTSIRASETHPGATEVTIRVPDNIAPAAFQPVVLRVGNLFSQPGVGVAIR